MLSKLRHVLDVKTSSSVYYAIFESHLCYASLVWAQNPNSVKRLIKRHLLHKKSLRISFCQSRHSHTGPLFKLYKILKSFDKTTLENTILIGKSLKRLCFLSSIAGTNFLLIHTLMILDRQILVILKYPLTVLKPMVDIQCL